MEEQNLRATTQERLIQFNIGDLNLFKENVQKQFFTIEKYFLETEIRIHKAVEEIKSISFNIRGICNSINISKSTVYNNPNTLRLYIEKRIDDIEKQGLLSNNKQGKTQERMSEIENFLDKAIIDQIEFNNMKVHNEHLQVEINRIQEKNELMAMERAQLVRKLNEMDLELRKLRNEKGNVTTIIRPK